MSSLPRPVDRLLGGEAQQMADYKHAVASGGDAVASRPVDPSRLARQISNRLTMTSARRCTVTSRHGRGGIRRQTPAAVYDFPGSASELATMLARFVRVS